MAVFTGRITKIEIGESAASHTDVTNAKFIRWRRNHVVTPRTLPSQKIPVGWLQGHSFVEGELGIVSEMAAAIASYYSDSADSTIIPYFKVYARAQDGAIKIFTITGGLIFNIAPSIERDLESVFVYHFVAYNVTGPT